jgi:hypothetical protein
MRFRVWTIGIFLSLLLSACNNIVVSGSGSMVGFRELLNRAFDTSLAIKKNELLSEFNQEFKQGLSSSRLNNLILILANNKYSESDKTELIIDSLEQGVLYNILAFKFDNREKIIDFFARREISRKLHETLYSYFFLQDFLDELERENLRSPILEKDIHAELDRLKLVYIGLTNDDGEIKKSSLPDLPSKFYVIPDNILLTVLNSNIALNSPYNRDYINIAMAVSDQLPPYKSLFEMAIKYNEILFQTPKSLYQNYSNELFIQSDCSIILGIVGINYELELLWENLKKIEAEYAIKNNEYILAKKSATLDQYDKLLELKKLELARFKAFLFLHYLTNFNKGNKVFENQKIPDNIRFLLEKTTLDVIKENM